MTEGLINLVEDDSSHDVHGAHEDEEQLRTSRFPPSAAIPQAKRPFAPAHVSGQAGAPGPVGVVVPPPRQSYPMGGNAPGGLYPSEPPPPLPRTSWWRSLIASTVAPGPGTEEESADRRIGKTCLGMAFGFALLALLVGLRGAPAEPSAVAVAIVTSRTVVALGLIAFGYGALRVGERFFTPRSKAIESVSHSR
jgi:hypothetical protein